jgi:hypothetical protein
VKLQRTPSSVTKEDHKDSDTVKKETFLWITVDNAMLERQHATVGHKYPIAVAIDHDG